jgi:hypothetical protein
MTLRTLSLQFQFFQTRLRGKDGCGLLRTRVSITAAIPILYIVLNFFDVFRSA